MVQETRSPVAKPLPLQIMSNLLSTAQILSSILPPLMPALQYLIHVPDRRYSIKATLVYKLDSVVVSGNRLHHPTLAGLCTLVMIRMVAVPTQVHLISTREKAQGAHYYTLLHIILGAA